MFKFVVNQINQFEEQFTVQLIALVSLILIILGQSLNMYCLLTQPIMELVIVHAVALEIIVELPAIFMMSLNSDALKERIFSHSHLHVVKKGSDIIFQKRDFTNKVFRVTYKFLRAIFISLFFYFQPFWPLYIYQFMPFLPEDDHGAAH